MDIQEGRVSVQENVVYGAGGGRDLYCDVYTPPAQEARAPALLLVHGGSWRNGDKSQLRGYGIQLARRGVVCVACEYRLSGDAHWPAQLDDVKAALRWMRAQADTLGIDPERICISGNSAGGHIALMVTATQNQEAFDGQGGNPGVATHVAACVAFYPPTVLEGEDELREAVRELLGPEATQADARTASPLHHAAAEWPPTMLITGNQDVTVPHEASLMLYARLCELGAGVELHTYNGAPHAFDAVPEFGRQCVELMALFLDRHAYRPRTIQLPVDAL